MTQPLSDGLLGASEIRRLAAELDIRPTKKLGQNFVVDGNTIRRIVRAAELGVDDVVLEVGPGLGSLTLGLLDAAAAVLVVEIDRPLAQRLPQTVGEQRPDLADRLTVINQDALTLTELPRQPSAVVANLPYNVSVPVLLHLFATFPTLRSGLVMVQSEVADRLVAGPGSKTYGVPSAKIAWYADAVKAGMVGRTVFWPVPNVESALVRLTRRQPPPAADRLATFAVIDAAFAQRRKTLRAALAGWAGGAQAAEQALRDAGIDPGTRAEQLDIGQFAQIRRPTG